MKFSSSVHKRSRILMDTTVVYVITSPCVATSIREIRHNIICTGIFHFVIWGRILYHKGYVVPFITTKHRNSLVMNKHRQTNFTYLTRQFNHASYFSFPFDHIFAKDPMKCMPQKKIAYFSSLRVGHRCYEHHSNIYQ